MSLLIKGMEMPKGCSACRCCVPEDVNSDSSSYYCALNNYLAWNTEHNIPDDIEAGCPLSEIPTPHGRLIDADVLMDLLEKSVPGKNRGHQFYVFRHMLRNAPTVIEAEEE